MTGHLQGQRREEEGRRLIHTLADTVTYFSFLSRATREPHMFGGGGTTFTIKLQ